MNVEMPQDFEHQIQQTVLKAITETVASLQQSTQYPEYMDIGKTCQYLAVSRGTLTKITKEYSIPSTILGGTIRFKRSEIDRFMLDHSTK